MGCEIEKKFLVKALPEDLERFPFHEITQGYLCRHPAVRVRREVICEGAGAAPRERYTMTYKGIRQEGVLSQEEYNLALTKEAYEHLLAKADGVVIEKKRVILPLNEDAFDEESFGEDPVLGAWYSAKGEEAPRIELDIFGGVHQGLMFAEVEFPSEETAAAYHAASWFGEEVTGDEHYSNAWLAENGPEKA